MSDKELIDVFVKKADSDGILISFITNVTVVNEISRNVRIDTYKGKEFDWTEIKDEPEEIIWSHSLNHLIDDDMRDNIKKYLVKHL